MKARLVPIGNSRGIRIPKAILDQCEVSDELEMAVEGQQIILSPTRQQPRKGWLEAAARMAAAGDDEGRPGAWPESEVARLERVVALLEALEQLPARERDVVVLHHAGGLTMVEIAERLGRHYDAVVRDRDRAQRTLRRLLESKGRR